MTSTLSPERRTWKFKALRTRIRDRFLSYTVLKVLKSISKKNDPNTVADNLACSSQLSLAGAPLSPIQPPPYLPQATPGEAPAEDNDSETIAPGTISSNPVYLHSGYPSGSLEDLFFASQESLPPFPDTVNEIVDLIRMAASLLYREIQLVLVAETQNGEFPSFRADTWARLGLLHRLNGSWPDSSFTALDGINSFKQSLNDGTIICEFVNRLLPTAELSPYYGSDSSAWASNIHQFITVYESFGLANSSGRLSTGNPAFEDLGVKELADYSRAIIAVQEQFGQTAASLLPPPSRGQRNSVTSFASLLRHSSLESFASQRSSAHLRNQWLGHPLLTSIHEDDVDVPESPRAHVDGGGRDSFEIPSSENQPAHILPTPGFLSVHQSLQLAPEPTVELPKETTHLYKCLLYIMNDEQRYQTMMATKGDDAQELLDFFQHLLDYPQITGTSRNDILTALIRLSTATGLHPQCLTLKFTDLQTDKTPIASGHFGDVMQGVCQGQRLCIKVVKLYQKSHIDTALKVFLKEAVLWAQLQHPNLLPFYGVYHLDDYHRRICLVSPWMEDGTITEYLRANPYANRLLLIRDIVRGLSFLHENKIVHGDLKGANILVTKAGHACLADFGLASLHNVEAIKFAMLESSGHCGGTPRWEAPELLDDSEDVIHRTPASDIYAFGCVCYEVVTGKIPFFELQNDFLVYIKVAKGERPSRPPSGSWPLPRHYSVDGIWAMIIHCWQQYPTQRPNASDILESTHLSDLADTRPREKAFPEPHSFKASLNSVL